MKEADKRFIDSLSRFIVIYQSELKDSFNQEEADAMTLDLWMFIGWLEDRLK